MKVGVMLPISDGDGPGRLQSFAETVAFARAAEDGGLDSAWLADHLFYRDADGTTHGLHEAWTWLTGIAAATSRVGLGHLVVCTSFRPPTLTAKLAVTLDAVSNGRFTLGLGCGWYEPEYRAMGLPFDHRVGRFEEALGIIGRLLDGERVTFHGRWYDVDEAELSPRPDRRIPILVAAGRDRMIDLTARHADAWNTAWYGAPNDRLAAQLATFDAALERAGRTRADVAPTVGVNVRDPDQSPPDHPDPGSFTGSADELVEVLDAYERLGVGHLMVGLEPMTIRSVERLADAVRRQRAA